MPTKFDYLSPGILLREIDQSILPPVAEDEGPVIIGRTRRGPALKPIKVRSLDDYLAVFGKPVPGGTTIQGDVWREGNLSAPTYASYAAQAWLASENSPVTVVRLLGAQNTDAQAAGYAGWQAGYGAATASYRVTVGAVGVPSVAHNAGAYGLFVVNSGSTATIPVSGALAAVFYMAEGGIMLSGTRAMHEIGDGKGYATMFSSTGNKKWKMVVVDDTNTALETIDFSLQRNDASYIRSVFNTNPSLVSRNSVEASNRKTYWLGESYLRHADKYLTDTTTGGSYAFMLALERTESNGNWGYRREGMLESNSGWVFGQDQGPYKDFQAENKQKLFRVLATSEGEQLQGDIVISMEDLKLPTNPAVNNYSSFTLKVLDFSSGLMMEQYANLNLNPASPDFIARRIGDMYQTWDEDKRRYKAFGDYPNYSDYIRIEVNASVATDGPVDSTALPWGFYGPIQPRPFSFSTSSHAIEYLPNGYTPGAGALAAFANPMAKGSGSVFVGYENFDSAEVTGPSIDGGTAPIVLCPNTVGYTASMYYPSIPLRNSGSDGFSSNPFKVYWGIRPTLSVDSTQKDPDYVDYVRRWNTSAYKFSSPAAGTDYSFIFSLDDLVIPPSNPQTIYYLSGSRFSGGSYTAKSGSQALLDKGAKQFVMPLFGGNDGLDITEKDPFRNASFVDGASDINSYLVNTMNRAIDSVADPELVPANLMVAPGFNKPIVTNKMMNTCERRKDMLAIIDLEGDYVPSVASTDSAATRRGSVSSAVSNLKNRNLNSSYACCFYPWVQITDNLNASERVWIPSSIAGLGAIGQSESRSELWFAPAGFNRGGLGNLGGRRGPRVVQARQRLDSGDRDDLYEVNINPIATFPNEGVVIFGQKTLQVTPSALDRINVRRLMIYLKSKVGAISRNLLFDQNVASTWARFKSQVNPLMSEVQARFGITEYKVVLDETTTTADLIDRNIMYAKIFLKPARAIEFIVVDFIITRTGADFA